MTNESTAVERIMEEVNAYVGCNDERLYHLRREVGDPDPDTGERDHEWYANPESADVFAEHEAKIAEAIEQEIAASERAGYVRGLEAANALAEAEIMRTHVLEGAHGRAIAKLLDRSRGGLPEENGEETAPLIFQRWQLSQPALQRL